MGFHLYGVQYHQIPTNSSIHPWIHHEAEMLPWTLRHKNLEDPRLATPPSQIAPSLLVPWMISIDARPCPPGHL